MIGLCDIHLGDLSHTLLLLHAIFRMLMGQLDSHQSPIRLHIEAGICSVPTADAVATAEANCNNDVVRLRSLPETISQWYCSAAQRILACDDGLDGDSGNRRN